MTLQSLKFNIDLYFIEQMLNFTKNVASFLNFNVIRIHPVLLPGNISENINYGDSVMNKNNISLLLKNLSISEFSIILSIDSNDKHEILNKLLKVGFIADILSNLISIQNTEFILSKQSFKSEYGELADILTSISNCYIHSLVLQFWKLAKSSIKSIFKNIKKNFNIFSFGSSTSEKKQTDKNLIIQKHKFSESYNKKILIDFTWKDILRSKFKKISCFDIDNKLLEHRSISSLASEKSSDLLSLNRVFYGKYKYVSIVDL